jgi:hypothetical protein
MHYEKNNFYWTFEPLHIGTFLLLLQAESILLLQDQNSRLLFFMHDTNNNTLSALFFFNCRKELFELGFLVLLLLWKKKHVPVQSTAANES